MDGETKLLKAIVTGGAGFIGSHLVDRLVERGDEVSVLDDLSAGQLSNLEKVLPDIFFHKLDITDYQSLLEVSRGIDVIFHLATQCLVKGNEEPMLIHSVNDVGTYNVCAVAKECGCKIVYVGTSEMYGHQRCSTINEESPLNPVSLYGITKVVGEQYVRFFHKIYDVPVVCIRPFNTFGPRQREDRYSGVITSFLKRIKNNLPLLIHGDGKQTRDFSYVSDIVDGILLLSKLHSSEVVNLGSGKDISIHELANVVVRSWIETDDLDAEIIFDEPRINDLRKLRAGISRAEYYGYSPKLSLQEGMNRYVEWYKSRCNWS